MLLAVGLHYTPDGEWKKQGNMADCKTLEGIINTLSRQTSFSGRKPIVVIAMAIATDDNLSMLKPKGYNYTCVSRSSLRAYYADVTATPCWFRFAHRPATLLLARSAWSRFL